MKKYISIILVLSLIMCPIISYAESTKTLEYYSLNSLLNLYSKYGTDIKILKKDIELYKINNEDLIDSYKDMIEFREDTKEFLDSLNETIDDYSKTYDNEDFNDIAYMHYLVYTRSYQELSYKQQLEAYINNGLMIDKAISSYENSEQNLQDGIDGLTTSYKIQCLQLYLSELLVDNLEFAKDLYAYEYETAKIKLSQGLINNIDLQQIALKLQQAENDYNELSYNYDLLNRKLTKMLNASLPSDNILKINFKPSDFEVTEIIDEKSFEQIKETGLKDFNDDLDFYKETYELLDYTFKNKDDQLEKQKLQNKLNVLQTNQQKMQKEISLRSDFNEYKKSENLIDNIDLEQTIINKNIEQLELKYELGIISKSLYLQQKAAYNSAIYNIEQKKVNHIIYTDTLLSVK